jgi:hypothetical protein
MNGRGSLGNPAPPALISTAADPSLEMMHLAPLGRLKSMESSLGDVRRFVSLRHAEPTRAHFASHTPPPPGLRQQFVVSAPTAIFSSFPTASAPLGANPVALAIRGVQRRSLVVEKSIARFTRAP